MMNSTSSRRRTAAAHPVAGWALRAAVIAGIMLSLAISFMASPGAASASTCPSIIIGNRSTGAVYLDYGWQKHHVTNPATFDALGLRWECVRWNDLRIYVYPTGANVPSVGVGSLIRNPSDGRVYVLNRGLHWVPNTTTFSALNFQWSAVLNLDSRAFAAFTTGASVPSASNNGFAYDPSTGAIYVIYYGLHHIPDPTSFNALCFDWSAALSVRWDPLVVRAVPTGSALPHLDHGYLIRNQDDGATYVVNCGLRHIPDATTFSAYGWAWSSVRSYAWWMINSMRRGSAIVSTTKPSSSRFSYGWCTWYVAERRAVPWSGGASKWWDNSAGAGFARGSVPMPGAVAVFIDPGDGRYGIPGTAENGHVAYVVWSDPSTGRFRVAEKFGPTYAASERDLQIGTPGTAGLVGFIYWQYR